MDQNQLYFRLAIMGIAIAAAFTIFVVGVWSLGQAG